MDACVTTISGHACTDTRPIGVLGLGHALPTHGWRTAALLDRMAERFGVDVKRAGRVVAKRLAVEHRYLCRELNERHEGPRAGDSNAELAARAVQDALRHAQLKADDLTYLIAHTATPGRLLPPNVAKVADLLGYRGPIVELRQACTGFANALQFATGLLHGPNAGPVAIVGSETGSVYFDPLRAADDHGQLVNMLQMGDGAGACVLAGLEQWGERSGVGVLSHLYFGREDTSAAPALWLDGGSDAPLATNRAAEFTHDFALVRECGPKLFAAGAAAARAMDIDLRAMDFIIPHQANGRIGSLLAPALGIDARRIFVHADRVGNTGSAAIWLALHALQARMRFGERAFVLGAEATQYTYGGFLYRAADGTMRA